VKKRAGAQFRSGGAYRHAEAADNPLASPQHCGEPALDRRGLGRHRRPARGHPARCGVGRRSRGRALHAHRHRRGAPRRSAIRRADRAGWSYPGARPQSGTQRGRSDRAWRDRRDPPLPRRAWPGSAERGDALHLGRALRDVHRRDPVVPHRVVFAASVPQLATRLDQIMVSSAEIAAKAPFAPLSITGGVLAEEAMRLFEK